ncbi:exonuclease domain-containing protein [Cyanobacterium sp. DS4]|uniref:exonuclease domain-containing protein n=1 Tax=Cyanobacterium sp. DS4 TaxID=2878255 RepID=UPI002E8153D3|nr:exonuclease domain-containing protein [Cyanobacterium sp. Dongsha4]WVK99837.1 DNA polymerase III [Cyanobacterium sp. Dongsha4]
MNFIVIDTEGSDTLREIAIINQDGKLIYEAFVRTRGSTTKRLNHKPLTEIVRDLQNILPNQNIICHNAQHDRTILHKSFRRCRQQLPQVQFICTLELAQEKHPNLDSYQLGNLSRRFFLQVDNLYFRKVQAHRARYDAQFTLQLYLYLTSHSRIEDKPAMTVEKIVTTPSVKNPFSSSRVDDPYQNHLDFEHIYKSQFYHLTSLVEEIRQDRENKQSRGALILGEAGSGKTHLIMRLAKATLKTNRLLYVRQPNNPNSVMHHIYSRILESFAQKVDIEGSQRTQLDLLLAHVFVNILKTIQQEYQSQKLGQIIKLLQNDSLSLYERLGGENTQRNRDNWKYIETKITQWWENNYSASGYAPNILQGIIKYCSYKDLKIKDKVRRWLTGNELDSQICEEIGLNNWQEDNLSREDFALEGIRLFGQLSTLDEPLIIVFDQLEYLIHKLDILTSFGNALREIITHVPNSLIVVNLFPDRWQSFQGYFDNSTIDRLSTNQLILQTPSSDELRKMLGMKCERVGTTLEELFQPEDLQIILRQSSIRKVINKASDYYHYRILSIPLPPPPKKISVEERLDKLENALQQLETLVKEIEGKIGPTPPPKPPIITSNDPILKYLEENERLIADKYHNPNIITDDDEYGKLVTIMEAFKSYDSSINIDHLPLGKKVIPENLLITRNKLKLAVGFLNIGGSAFTSRIKNFNQLVISNRNIKFYLLRDKKEGYITGKVGLEEIDKLNYTENGSFLIINKEARVIFELIYKMIVAINQNDLEVSMTDAIKVVLNKYGNYWLIREIFPTNDIMITSK